MKEERNNKAEQNSDLSTEAFNETINNSEYYVNIDGEDVKVDCKSDEDYSCLLNCLEGYYVYGIGRDDDDNNEDDCGI